MQIDFNNAIFIHIFFFVASVEFSRIDDSDDIRYYFDIIWIFYQRKQPKIDKC